MSKVENITDGISDILKEYSESGITKNRLIQNLIERKVCSRETFYSYYKAGKFGRLFEERGEGKYQKLYPTNSTKNLTVFKLKLQKIEKMLDFVKEWDYGDLLWQPQNTAKNLKVNSKQFKFWLSYHTHFEDVSDVDHIMNRKKKSKSMDVVVYSVMGRHDFLKNLPLFLVNKISEYAKDEESSKEYFLLIQPIIIKTLKTLQSHYTSSNLLTDNSLNMFYKPNNEKSIKLKIKLITGISDPNVNANFLKILGRYYFALSTQFAKDMQLESSREQKIVSDVIKEFYVKNPDLEDVTEITDWNNFLLVHETSDKISDKLHEEFHKMYDDSIGVRLIEKSENVKNNDPYFLRNYYVELFHILDIMTEPETKILCFHDQKMRERENKIEEAELSKK